MPAIRLGRDLSMRSTGGNCILINPASSDKALAFIAAGPLEDLLKKHGPVVIDCIENESEENARLQLALSGVWDLTAATLYLTVGTG
jgi:hypothetical protein